MNIKDVQKLKEYYENALSERIAQLIGIDKQFVIASWSLEHTNIKVVLADGNTYTSFVFVYDGKEFIIKTRAYSIIANEEGVVGITTENAAISLNTIHAIFDIVVETLESSPEDPNEEDCEDCENCENCENSGEEQC